MSLESGQLLLRQDTTVTCPKCADEFSLDQGFAKKALGQLSEASAGAIAAMREAERAQVERRAEQPASEKARAARVKLKSQEAAEGTGGGSRYDGGPSEGLGDGGSGP